MAPVSRGSEPTAAHVLLTARRQTRGRHASPESKESSLCAPTDGGVHHALGSSGLGKTISPVVKGRVHRGSLLAWVMAATAPWSFSPVKRLLRPVRCPILDAEIPVLRSFPPSRFLYPLLLR